MCYILSTVCLQGYAVRVPLATLAKIPVRKSNSFHFCVFWTGPKIHYFLILDLNEVWISSL